MQDETKTIISTPYRPLQDFEQKDEKFETYRSIIWKTSVRASKILIAFTYSLELPLLFIILGRLPSNNKDNTQSLAVATLIVNVFDTAVLIPGVVSFAMMLEGGEIYGKITDSTILDEEKENCKKDIERLIKNSLVLASPFVLISAGLLIFSKAWLVNLFGQDEEISELAQQFLRPAAAIIPLTTIRFIFQQIFIIHQHQKWMITVSVVSFLFGGGFLTYAFGYGMEVILLPGKGIFGVFAGILAENFISTLGVGLCLYQAKFKDYRFATSFYSWSKHDYKQIIHLIKQLFPIEAAYLSELATILAKIFQAGFFGVTALAVQNFAGQLAFLSLLFAHVFSQAVSLNINGTKNEVYKGRLARGGLLASLIFSSLVCIPIGAYPQILTVFGDVTSEVMSSAQIVVPLAAGTSILYTLSLTMLQSLRTKPNHIKSTIAFNAWLWTSVLGSYLLGFPLELGIKGIGIGSLLGTALGTAHLFVHLLRAFPQPSSSSMSIQTTEPPRVSSSWCGYFSPVVNRCKNWFYGKPATARLTPG